ncbi:sigma-54-dependent Fis family transcriptional regulator [Rheinheimera sediminis]|uniref:sigma-54-dependent transcriptional regulator n=1 Tax=Rheinheimera sp. YQF-1 TaxID=2499626 RepID=UPI000FDA9E52|nr:sigma-54 dependent transcriptional regulator [Rheinheimera sp. YQF-1]RVT47182.1 sigma-54-dependent Fis family transcriptional regulator [Rheinheimera sp. YQF-1]
MANIEQQLPAIIFIDDEADIRSAVSQLFKLEDLPCVTTANPAEVLSRINTTFSGIVITDMHMPALNGLELLQKIHAIDAEIPVVMLTGYGAVSLAVKAMQQGAYDFLEKPFDNDHLLEVSRRALEKRHLVLENRQLKAAVEREQQPGLRILGQSPAMQQLRRTLDAVIHAPADVLIYGETGTGKELVARYLHEQSDRRQHNFVAINCGAIPEQLIESELFGAEAGAFTGADKKRIGKFEFANGGTLLLDEIESTPMSLQVKLLRVLEERKVTRLGSNQAIDLDIRIIAASKVDLKQLAASGEFRSDLYYRLSLVDLHLPALRQRKDDVFLLFSHFARIAAARFHKEYIPLKSTELQQLAQHQWPGNVRELRNMAERYVLMGTQVAFSTQQHKAEDGITGSMSLQQRVEYYEKMLLEEALNQHKGAIKAVMAELDLPRKTLYDKMAKYQLTRRDFLDKNED